jgi:DNA-binding NarL/FixJ family response regulator
VECAADVHLLVSRGDLEEDLAAIREAHLEATGVRILLMGTTRENGEFLQCFRAGIDGYLRRDASVDDAL